MDQKLTIKDLLELIEKIESRINSYWNFYTIIVLATVGWLMSSKKPFSFYQTIALTVAITIFFAANFGVMRMATKRVVALENELQVRTKTAQFEGDAIKTELSKPSMALRLKLSYILHIVVDLAVVFAIWSKLA
jgi:hypothetical protein